MTLEEINGEDDVFHCRYKNSFRNWIFFSERKQTVAPFVQFDFILVFFCPFLHIIYCFVNNDTLYFICYFFIVKKYILHFFPFHYIHYYFFVTFLFSLWPFLFILLLILLIYFSFFFHLLLFLSITLLNLFSFTSF